MTADKGTAMQGTVAIVASLHTKREGVRVAVQHLLLLHARVVRVGALRLDSHPVQLRQGALSCLPRQLHAEVERRAGRLRIVTYLADPAVAAEVDARKARRVADVLIHVFGDGTLHAYGVTALVRGGAEGRAWQPLIVPPNLIRHVAVPGGVHVKVISAKQVRTLIGIDRHQLGAVDTRQLCDLGVEVKDLLPRVAAIQTDALVDGSARIVLAAPTLEARLTLIPDRARDEIDHVRGGPSRT